MLKNSKELAGVIDNKNILIIDDIIDSGKTCNFVQQLFPSACFAAVYAKLRGKLFGNVFATKVSQDTWIQFPWETTL